MAIRFRCTHCHSLMAISSQQAGATVQCPTCGEPTEVPSNDQFTLDSSGPAESIVEAANEDVLETDEEKFLTGEEIPSPNPASQSRIAEHEEHNQTPAAGELDQEPFVPSEIGDDGDEVNSDAPLTFRRHKNLDEEMDLTPMVDVTFQLLIFFMVSASFSLQKSIEVPTPDPDQKGASQQVQSLDDLQGTSIIVKIDSANTIYIDDEPLGDVLRLPDTLRDKMRREQKTELLVTADTQSLHRTIIAVIDAANEVGMQKIRMTSKKKSE